MDDISGDILYEGLEAEAAKRKTDKEHITALKQELAAAKLREEGFVVRETNAKARNVELESLLRKANVVVSFNGPKELERDIDAALAPPATEKPARMLPGATLGIKKGGE